MVNWSWKMGLDEMCSYKHTHNGAVHTAFRNNPVYFADPMGDWPKWLGGKGRKRMKKTPGQKKYAGERYKYGKNDKAHPVSGKTNAEIQTEKQKGPNKINWDMSGYLTKGGFVTDRYLRNLAEKAGEHEWARQLYDRIEARTYFNYLPEYSEIHSIPDYGKAYGKANEVIFMDITGTNENTFLGVFHEGKTIYAGVGLLPIDRTINKPKTGSALAVISSYTLEKKIADKKREILGKMWASYYEAEEATNNAIQQFRFGIATQFRFEAVGSPSFNQYRIKVNYRIK